MLRLSLIILIILGLENALFAQEKNNSTSMIFDIGVAMGSGIGGTMHLNIIPNQGGISLGYTGFGAYKPGPNSKRSRSFEVQYSRLFDGKKMGYTIVSIGPSFVKTGYYEWSSGGWFSNPGYVRSENIDEDLGFQLDCKFVASNESPSIAFDIFLNYNPGRSFGGLSINLAFGRVKS